jgi:hypothetical protein
MNGVLLLFPEERPVFMREVHPMCDAIALAKSLQYAKGMYSTFSYFVAKNLAEAPFQRTAFPLSSLLSPPPPFLQRQFLCTTRGKLPYLGVYILLHGKSQSWSWSLLYLSLVRRADDRGDLLHRYMLSCPFNLTITRSLYWCRCTEREGSARVRSHAVDSLCSIWRSVPQLCLYSKVFLLACIHLAI